MRAAEFREFREELQDSRNSVALVLEIAMSGVEFSEEAKNGLTQLGITTRAQLNTVVNKICDYTEGNTASCSNNSRC